MAKVVSFAGFGACTRETLSSSSTTAAAAAVEQQQQCHSSSRGADDDDDDDEITRSLGLFCVPAFWISTGSIEAAVAAAQSASKKCKAMAAGTASSKHGKKETGSMHARSKPQALAYQKIT